VQNARRHRAVQSCVTSAARATAAAQAPVMAAAAAVMRAAAAAIHLQWQPGDATAASSGSTGCAGAYWFVLSNRLPQLFVVEPSTIHAISRGWATLPATFKSGIFATTLESADWCASLSMCWLWFYAQLLSVFDFFAADTDMHGTLLLRSPVVGQE
jgi:hypothetical protein